MKDCFEYGTPETLPFLIAHAFITVVSNVSVVFTFFCTIKHIITSKRTEVWKNCRSREAVLAKLSLLGMRGLLSTGAAFHHPNPMYLL